MIDWRKAEQALEAIREEGLSKAEVLSRYDAVVGVADVTLDVKRGEIFCIMGLSGSGKSTLVRHFNRLLEPTAGKIIIEGTDVMALPPKELMAFRNKKIGMVFQNFALMPHRSVLDNVAMPLEIRHVSKNDRLAQASKILEIVELSAWGNKFAHELSGGMQQRVGLARALAADPDVLLMDEPLPMLTKLKSGTMVLWTLTSLTFAEAHPGAPIHISPFPLPSLSINLATSGRPRSAISVMLFFSPKFLETQ